MTDGTEVSLTSGELTIKDKDINGFLVVKYDGDEWIGYVLDRDPELKEATISFLHPKMQNPSYFYPRREDVLII